MVARREASCPLCGASLSAEQMLDACSGIVDGALGVLEAQCPFCQGYLEVVPANGHVELGYVVNTGTPHFSVVLSLACDGLSVERSDAIISVVAGQRRWQFTD
jgi:hypothetical protein